MALMLLKSLLMHHPFAYEYGIIGNSLSSALVNRMGSIEWCCFPYLDSPCHFGVYLGQNLGGRFQISPQGEFRSKQRYLQNSNILETFFETPTGTGTLIDWMPSDHSQWNGSRICRQIKTLTGTIHWFMTCYPRFNYGEDTAQAENHLNGILFRGSRFENLAYLQSEVPIDISPQGHSASSHFILETNQTARFQWIWGRITRHELSSLETIQHHWESLAHTCPKNGCLFGGPWHEHITRSHLLLKLLCSPDFGTLSEGIAISSTHSRIGEARVWEDRSASFADAAWIIQGLVHLGLSSEAKSYFRWISEILDRDGVENLQSHYTLDGGKTLPTEQDFQNSRKPSGKPVSRGFQLDIYGQVILAAWKYFQAFGELPPKLWPRLVEIADYICQAWKRPDYGSHGHSNKAEHFVISKVFCWAALHQISLLADALHQPHSPRWKSEKNILHKMICEQGYDSERNTFVRSFGDREINTTCLWLPFLNFLPLDDPRIQGTLDRINLELSNGVFFKQTQIDSDHPEVEVIDFKSSFLYCAALAICGRIDEASDRIAELCTYSSKLGYFGDLIFQNPHPETLPGMETVSHTFPSSKVHLCLVNAILYLSWAKGRNLPKGQLMGCPEPIRYAQSA